MSLLVVGSAPSLEGAAGDLVREILSEARVEFAIVTDSERLESALKPGAALLVGQAGVELFRAAGACCCCCHVGAGGRAGGHRPAGVVDGPFPELHH